MADDSGPYVMGTPRSETVLRGYYDAPPTGKVITMTAWRDSVEAARAAVIVPCVYGATEERAEHRVHAIMSARRQSVPVVVLGVTADYGEDAAAVARNQGMRLARDAGIEWAAFLDDDDLLDPQHVEKLLDRARETGADVVYPRFRVHGGSYARRRSLGDLALLMEQVGWRDGQYFRDALRQGNFIPVTALVRVEAALSAGGFPTGEDVPRHPYPPHPRVEDWGLWLRMLDAGARFAQLPEVTWTWRQWSGSTSARYWEGVEG